MTRHAIVAGAGLAGLASAKALQDAGWQVTVLEEDAEHREVGAGLALSANGMRALDALGVGDAVREAAACATPEGVRSSAGSVLFGPPETASSRVCGIHRSTLHRILRDALEGADIVTGAQVTGATAGIRPSVTIARGDEDDERTADLVIGADGIDSPVRTSLWPKARPDYSGASCWRAVIAAQPDTPAGFTQWLGRGAEFGIVPIDGERAYWYGFFRARMGVEAPDEAAAARARFGGWDGPVGTHVAATPDTAVVRRDVMHLPTTLRTFVAERVALVGDAAHAMVPTLGQGANTAFEDAATLGVLLADTDTDAALAEYDRLRLPRTQRLQRLSLRAYRLGAGVRGRVALAARNAVFALTPTLATEIAADWHLAWEPPTR